MFSTLKIRAKGSLLYIANLVAWSLVCAAIWLGLSAIIANDMPPDRIGGWMLVVFTATMGSIFGTMMWAMNSYPSKAALEAPSIFPKTFLRWRPLYMWVGLNGFFAAYTWKTISMGEIASSIFLASFFTGIVWSLAAMRYDRGLIMLRASERKVLAAKLSEDFEAFQASQPAPDKVKGSLIEIFRNTIGIMTAEKFWLGSEYSAVLRDRLRNCVRLLDTLEAPEYKKWFEYAHDLAHQEYNIEGFRLRLGLA